MRYESSITSVSWIPSEGVPGPMRLPFDLAPLDYDAPPPAQLGDLAELRDANRYRFANELRAWIEVEDGRIVDFGHAGQGWMGSTHMRVGRARGVLQGKAFRDLRPDPVVGADFVRFTQTTGGMAGIVGVRAQRSAPFVTMRPPSVWTTLELTITADGSSSWRLLGASEFPRHWVYDHDGQLVGRSGLLRFGHWLFAGTREDPWHDVDLDPRVAPPSTEPERLLSTAVMAERGRLRRLPAGAALVVQGDVDDEVYLVLDGVLEIDVDGRRVAEVGPGGIIGERAAVEGRPRTSSVRATTAVKVAVARPADLDRRLLAAVGADHRREHAPLREG